MTSEEQTTENANNTAESTACKVFVGNLSYTVDDARLKEYFGEAGTVTDAKVIYRYGRPAGYGFVTFSTEEEAEKAVALKDTELEGRKVNVERAVPKSNDDSSRRWRGRSRARGRGYGRGRGARRTREPLTGEPSKTTVFVGNLPFNVIDQDLVNIFANFKLDKAHVVRRFNGASRGFGFVTLTSEDEQKNALQQLAEVWCDDRKLVVRAALSDEAHKGAAKETETAETA